MLDRCLAEQDVFRDHSQDKDSREEIVLDFDSSGGALTTSKGKPALIAVRKRT